MAGMSGAPIWRSRTLGNPTLGNAEGDRLADSDRERPNSFGNLCHVALPPGDRRLGPVGELE